MKTNKCKYGQHELHENIIGWLVSSEDLMWFVHLERQMQMDDFMLSARLGKAYFD